MDKNGEIQKDKIKYFVHTELDRILIQRNDRSNGKDRRI